MRFLGRFSTYSNVVCTKIDRNLMFYTTVQTESRSDQIRKRYHDVYVEKLWKFSNFHVQTHSITNNLTATHLNCKIVNKRSVLRNVRMIVFYTAKKKSTRSDHTRMNKDDNYVHAISYFNTWNAEKVEVDCERHASWRKSTFFDNTVVSIFKEP